VLLVGDVNSAGEFFERREFFPCGEAVTGMRVVLSGLVVEPVPGFVFVHLGAEVDEVGLAAEGAGSLDSSPPPGRISLYCRVIRKSCGRFDRNSHLTPLIRQSKAGYENSGGLVRLGID
jgi:hypothetical protein